MREILLNPNDFDLFDNELQPSDYDFFQSHKDTFRTMWIDQGRQFWTYFLMTYKCYHVEFGLIKSFPARSAEYGAIVEEAFSYMASNFVEGKASDAKTYIMDIAVLARSKSLVHHLETSETKFSPKDPFYYKDTREVYRKIFGEPTETKSRLKVYCQFDILVMFAGSVVRCLRRWLDSPNLNSLESPYWVEHESMYEDLQIICAKPGSDKIDLDFDRYQKEMEMQYMIKKNKMKESVSSKKPAEGRDASYPVSPQELIKKTAAHNTAVVLPSADVKPKESLDNPEKSVKEKKKKKKKVKAKDEGFSEVFTIPGVQQRLGVGTDSVTAEFKVSDPYDNYPVRFTQRIKDMGKYQKVQLLYEKDTPTGTIKKALYTDMEEFDEQDFHLYIAELLHNPDKMVDITEDETNADLPMVGKKIVQATSEEQVLEKEPAVFSREAELRIAESLAKSMNLTDVDRALKNLLKDDNETSTVPASLSGNSGNSGNTGPLLTPEALLASLINGSSYADADLESTETQPFDRQQSMKDDLKEKLRTQNLVAETQREKEKVTKIIELFWRTEERRKREGDTSPDCLANVLKDCDEKGLSVNQKEEIIMQKMRRFVSQKFSEERQQLAEERKQKEKLQEKKPHPSGRDLAVEIPMFAKAFDVDLPPPPPLKKNKKGKLMKTRLREEEVVRTLLSADQTKYIEATTFKEPGAPHARFFIDIPKTSCSEPKYRYCDPHKNRTIIGPVRHELLIGLMHRHTLYLCPKDGEVEKEFLRINPHWESKGVLMLTDTPENDKRINNSVLYNKPMPDFDSKLVASTAKASNAKTPVASPKPFTGKKADLKVSSKPVSSAIASTTQEQRGPSKGQTPGLGNSGKNRSVMQAAKHEEHPHLQAKNQLGNIEDVPLRNTTNQRPCIETEAVFGANEEFQLAGSDSQSPSLKCCSNCHKTEHEPRVYKKCQRCKHELVIDARYYCGKECQVEDWKTKHRKEHKDAVLDTYNSNCD